jgi:hypothetical protein
VIGERSPNNPQHWFWAYCWDEKHKGGWITRKRGVPREKLTSVRQAIEQGKTVKQILRLL